MSSQSTHNQQNYKEKIQVWSIQLGGGGRGEHTPPSATTLVSTIIRPMPNINKLIEHYVTADVTQYVLLLRSDIETYTAWTMFKDGLPWISRSGQCFGKINWLLCFLALSNLMSFWVVVGVGEGRGNRRAIRLHNVTFWHAQCCYEYIDASEVLNALLLCDIDS